MAKFICPEDGHEQDGHNISIKVIGGEVRHDIKCDECGQYMVPKNKKVGSPSFRSTRWGRVL